MHAVAAAIDLGGRRRTVLSVVFCLDRVCEVVVGGVFGMGVHDNYFLVKGWLCV